MEIKTPCISQLIQPILVTFDPKPDITAYELAKLLPLIGKDCFIMPDKIPTDENLRRHLVIEQSNNIIEEKGNQGERKCCENYAICDVPCVHNTKYWKQRALESEDKLYRFKLLNLANSFKED